MPCESVEYWRDRAQKAEAKLALVTEPNPAGYRCMRCDEPVDPNGGKCACGVYREFKAEPVPQTAQVERYRPALCALFNAVHAIGRWSDIDAEARATVELALTIPQVRLEDTRCCGAPITGVRCGLTRGHSGPCSETGPRDGRTSR